MTHFDQRPTYAEMRSQFIQTATQLGAIHISYNHDRFQAANGHGSREESLITDVATVGEIDAPTCVFVVTGSHGVKLPIGSRLLCESWMASAADVCARRQDVRFVFVHGVSPYGAIHATRGDENNVDVMRNFIDFGQPLPAADAYHSIADILTPRSLTLLGKTTWLCRIVGKVVGMGGATHFGEALRHALVDGQYNDPSGMFFGGSAPSSSRLILESIAQDLVRRETTETLYHVDVHTGHGGWGQLNVLCEKGGEAAAPRWVRAMAEEVPEIVAEPIDFRKLTGAADVLWPARSMDANAEVVPLVLEFGTTKLPDVLKEYANRVKKKAWMPPAVSGVLETQAADMAESDLLWAMIMRDALRVRYGDRHPLAARIQAVMHEAFAPSSPEWNANALKLGNIVWRNMLQQIQATPR